MRDHTAAVISAKLDNDEINDAASPTLAFHIGRHAVTVDQFRAYVQHSGQVPGSPHTMQPADNHPVVKVSFHDALAYCAWLQDRLINDPALAAWPLRAALQQGALQVCLPSELEWEKAAWGGLQDKVFSWGDEVDPERANCRSTGRFDRLTVGCFAANGYGLHDMLVDAVQAMDLQPAANKIPHGCERLSIGCS